MSKGTTASSKTRPSISSKPAKTSHPSSQANRPKDTTERTKTAANKPMHKPPLAASTTKVSRNVVKAEPVTALSRGLKKHKDVKNTVAESSASSLTDVEVNEKTPESVPFKSLEPTGTSEVSSYNADRSMVVVVGGISVNDGISFPDIVISSPDTCTLFQVLAHRIRKWKILGRYMGLTDDELDEIERSNHFTDERCLKMLIHWGRNYSGKYSQLEAGIHNIMREDLIEDIRQYLPQSTSSLSIAQQCSEEENELTLKFSAFKINSGVPDMQSLTNRLTAFVRRRATKANMIVLLFSHEKLTLPMQIYIPYSTQEYYDLTVLQELCFAAWKRNVHIVDLTFEIRQF